MPNQPSLASLQTLFLDSPQMRERQSLVNDGACLEHPDLDFIGNSSGATTKAVRTVCQGCLVRVECFEYGQRYHEVGVYGGFGSKQRGRMPHTATREDLERFDRLFKAKLVGRTGGRGASAPGVVAVSARRVYEASTKVCAHGHQLTPENARTRADGRLVCRVCVYNWTHGLNADGTIG